MMMMKQPPYSVPTKQGDESERPTANVVEDTQQQQQQQQHGDDAFSRYSNDLQRMKAILLLTEDQDLQADDDDDVEALAAINRALSRMGMTNITRLNQDNTERREGNNSRSIQQGNVRKTRLSWELHPILLDALDNEDGVDAFDDDGSARRIADDGDDEGDNEGDDKATEQQAPSQVQDQEE